jgi:transposase
MPRKSDSIAIGCNFLDRRMKLLPCQKERMKWMYENSGLSYNQLAKKYGVSKRLIILYANPEIEEHSKDLYRQRRKDGRYYKKDKHTKAIREHRNYKKDIINVELWDDTKKI